MGDALGQKIHDILWRPVARGDAQAAAKRLDDLRRVLASLSADELAGIRKRLESGDLAPDFEYRLATATRERLLRELTLAENIRRARTLVRGIANRALSGRQSQTRGVGPAPSVPGTLSSKPAIDLARGTKLVNAAVGRSFKLVEKRVYSRQAGGLHIIVMASGNITLTAMQTDPATVNAYVSLSGGGKSVELDIADALFGADASITASSSGEFSVGVGKGGFSIELSPSLTSPVSLEFPSVQLAGIALEKSVPRLGLKGRADLSVHMTVDVIPDYAKLARTIRSGGPALKKAVRKGMSSFAKTAVKIKRGVGKVLAVGKRAIDRIVMRQLNKFARKVVFQWVKDLMEVGGKATMTKAASKVARKTVSRTLGALGLFLESKSAFEAGIQDAIRKILKRTQARLRSHFGTGFAYVIVRMTDSDWRDWMTRFSDTPMSMHGFGAPFPSSMDRWLIPRGEDAPLTKWLEGPGQTRTKSALNLHDDNWVERLESAIRGAVHAEIRWGGRDSRTEKIRDVAEDEANAAGRAAAYQAIWAFLAAVSDPEGKSTWKLDGPSQWDALAELYRDVFTGDDLEQYLAIQQLIDFDDYRLPPFAR